ncbi:hypothetical protein CJP72_23890 [Citrobacter sp. NCU1]|uniref:YdhW family putative oxidoreductase system protein n=1 Tax=Citrobacter sp. NCU1 TaxID=2026683 RepID=UPI001390CCA3|nr:YdhW family putative oxidoreductase system protein [Citrobacter sp. NCU1]NDO83677.1 hypothetical protein [Citrobacter sp. NCU1]
MTNPGEVLTLVEEDPDNLSEIDSNKRKWLKVRRQNEEGASELQVQESVNPTAIVADFIRQHSASGKLVARSLFLLPPYSLTEEDLMPLLETLSQEEALADITCIQGTEDDYFYSTHTMTANYADMCVQVMEKDICRAIAAAVRFDCQTYPRPYKVAMLELLPYCFEAQQIEAALAAMDTHPDYADIRSVASSNAVPYLFSERFMSYGKAYGLCEWLEVEQYQNP